MPWGWQALSQKHNPPSRTHSAPLSTVLLEGGAEATIIFRLLFFFFFFFFSHVTHLVITFVRVSKANEKHPIALFRLLCTRCRVCYACTCALPGLAGFSDSDLIGRKKKKKKNWHVW